MPNINNARIGIMRPNRHQTANLVLYALIIIAIIGGYLVYRHHQNVRNAYHAIENRSAPFAEQELKNHDYASYQMRLSNDANDYIAQQNYKDAGRVLNEITTNVPQNKIISQTYRAYWYLYKQTGDVPNRKKYAQLTADKLRQEGQAPAAAAFESDAKGN